MTTLPQLVLVDGLPGSGKSTTAHLLSLHLRRLGHQARWYWELEAPHPVLEFHEPIEGDRLRDGLVESTLHRWTAFAATLNGTRATTIVESTFLQSLAQPMFALDWPAHRIAAFVRDVERAIGATSAFVVLLRHRDIKAAFEESSRIRGEWFPSLIESKVGATPYAKRRRLEGRSGVIAYLRAYQDLTEQIVRQLTIPHLIVDVDADRGAAIPALLAAFGLPSLEAVSTTVSDLRAFAAQYRRVDTEDLCRIVTDGTHLYVEGQPNTRLLQVGERTFELSGTCVEFQFHPGPAGAMERLECRGNFPGLAPSWVRHA